MKKRIFMFTSWVLPAVFILAVVFGTVTGAQAAPYFQGKSITFIVPSGAGGGTDTFGRMVGKHLRKHIPGKPNIFIRDVPAAGGVVAANYVYTGKTDGRTVLVSTSKTVIAGFLRPKGLVFELQKMQPIYASPIGGVFYAKPGIIKEPKDLVTAKGLVFGHGVATSGTTSCFIWPKALLGIKTEKMVLGYDGSGPARLAFLSGEVNFSGGSTIDYNASMKTFVDKGEAVPIYQTGILDEKGDIVKEPAAPADIPTVKELYIQIYGKKPSGPMWEATKLVFGARTFGKCILLPEKVPQKIADIFREAAAKMIKDKKFLEEADRLTPGAAHLFGEGLVKAYPKGVSGDPELVDFMKKYLSKEYDIAFD